MASTYLDFVTVDVFTSKRYEGNPLAIVKVPKACQLSQGEKQAIAREFNLSETTFLHEAVSEEDGWTVDIFITTGELPFAGHPTIGTGFHVFLSEIARGRGTVGRKIEAKLKVKAGLIGLEYDIATKVVRAAIPHDVHIHHVVWPCEELKKMQPKLAEARNGKHPVLKDHYPIVSVVKGLTFILIELEDEEMLGQIQTTAQGPWVDGLDEGWNDVSFVGSYFYVRLGEKGDGTSILRTRMIEGTVEDPATGSAASDLAAYLSLTEGRPGETLRYAITQGVEMGRRSEIDIEVVLAEDSGIANVYLEGTAVQVMEGRLAV
ncbi:Diaminopimelate epimerase-like protein [Lindgomyces ingoldianus]|uniref:Diaminopimelate epimerase-like protein n=1 Tax=Lindgomyces ingoldianus TaxID=673940 RepID=A0ACB6RHR0_9PLEO|nr:Diaminopimelate epimerase-like protein [Lindgomyces ingoldianus]KAF2478011.1 Diaminopimelate epimerase-like protein [Lindgomyces ingoldianus]